MKALIRSLVAAAAIFICGVTLTGFFAAAMVEINYFHIDPIYSAIAIDLLAWGAPSFIASTIITSTHRTHTKSQALIAAATVLVLITTITSYDLYTLSSTISAANKHPTILILFGPYLIVCLATAIGIYTGGKVQAPN